MFGMEELGSDWVGRRENEDGSEIIWWEELGEVVGKAERWRSADDQQKGGGDEEMATTNKGAAVNRGEVVCKVWRCEKMFNEFWEGGGVEEGSAVWKRRHEHLKLVVTE